MQEVFVMATRWFNVESMPLSHVFPLEDRPGDQEIHVCRTIPVIDLGRNGIQEGKDIVQGIIEASQEFGFFQVINHDVPGDIITNAVELLKEFFVLPAEEISKEADSGGGNWLYVGSKNMTLKGAHLWRDNIKHPCHPLEECSRNWPQKPTRYRDVMTTYIVEIRRLSLRILELISEGLGLENGYLGAMSRVQFLTANNYPPCPDPALALGLPKHLDHNLITILYQGDVEGLQVLNREGKWIGVEAVPNSFVINIGTQVEIISNGKLRSAEHRVVTNTEKARTTITTFINPSLDSVIEPAKALINESNPSRYPSLSFKEFLNASEAYGPYTDSVSKMR